jgi:hypothetical protein
MEGATVLETRKTLFKLVSLPIVFRFFVDGTEAGAADAGVVDEDGDGAKFLLSRFDETGNVTGIGYIDGLRTHRCSVCRQFRGRSFESPRVASAQTDGGAELGEPRGNCFADTATATSHYGNVPREVSAARSGIWLVYTIH